MFKNGIKKRVIAFAVSFAAVINFFPAVSVILSDADYGSDYGEIKTVNNLIFAAAGIAEGGDPHPDALGSIEAELEAGEVMTGKYVGYTGADGIFEEI